MAWGRLTGAYLSKDQVEKVDNYVAQNQEIYSSRNHFIRAAIEHRLRLEEFLIKFTPEQRKLLRIKLLRTEE